MSPTALGPFRMLLLAGAAAALVAAAAWWLHRRRRRPVVYPPAAERCAEGAQPGTRPAEILALFGELRAGSTIGGWRIVDIYADDRGCVPVLLASRGGAPFRIDVLQRDAESPSPPAQTDTLALYVSGMRAGSTTPEDCVRGAQALAAALRAVGAAPPPWLLTMRAREVLLRQPRPAAQPAPPSPPRR